MMLFVVDPETALVVAGPDLRPRFTPEEIVAIAAQHPGRALFVREGDLDTWPDAHAGWLVSVQDGQVVAVEPDPDYTPPAPAPDPVAVLQDHVGHLAEVVAKNIPSTPHDRRYLTDKEIGKLLIPWLKAHPAATVVEATNYVVPLILSELPGQPVIPPLYWEWTDPQTQEVHPCGLAMSYLYEARVRGYCPAETPLTWAALVGLVVATQEEEIAGWLRSL